MDAHAGAVVVHVTGDVDLSNADGLSRSIDEAVARAASSPPRWPGGPLVVVDLSVVTFLDSQALAVLSDLAARHGHGPVALAVVAPPRSIAGELLAMTGMADVLPVHPSLDEAHRRI